MRITIIGTGYVGLVTGACLAQVGNDVLCLDTDTAKIDTLNNGGIPIHEPGLDELVTSNRRAGRLHFTTDIARATEHGQIQFIAVGTPPGEGGSADLSYAVAAARSIGRHMTEYKVVVDKSTVPVGTADRVQAAIAEELAARGADLPFAVVANPEFLKEGAAIQDFQKPDRIIVGSSDPRALELMRRIYAPFNRNHDRLITMDARSAELTKYAAGATVSAFDPAAMDVARELLRDKPGVRFANSAGQALHDADALIIVTEWNEFRSPDFEQIRSRLKAPLVFDGRNLFEPEEMQAQGFEYFPFGRSLSATA